jgi:hypothetical protein
VAAPLETFPILVQHDVTVAGATAGTPTLVAVPAGKIGFRLDAPASGLDNLIIDGGMQAGNWGIVASNGSAATTKVTNVEVRSMGENGINVQNTGTLTLGSGVSCHDNGTTMVPRSGLAVYNTAKAIIAVDAGGKTAAFDGNSGAGIAVYGSASLTIGGTLDVVARASGNVFEGLSIQQTPGSAPANVVSHFQALNSPSGNGIEIFGGSSLKLRSSQTKGNLHQGIVIRTYVNGTTKSDDVSQIDLGLATEAGGNTFQYATGAGPNGGAGICLDLTPTAGQTLNAAGNVFEAANCASGTTALTHQANACAGGLDYGILGSPTTNKITLARCM